MPVILPADDYDLWLAGNFGDSKSRDKDKLLDLLRPFPADDMKYYPVSKIVNSPAHEQPACVEPIAL